MIHGLAVAGFWNEDLFGQQSVKVVLGGLSIWTNAFREAIQGLQIPKCIERIVPITPMLDKFQSLRTISGVLCSHCFAKAEPTRAIRKRDPERLLTLQQ